MKEKIKTHYLLRLDDACPFMDREKWRRVEKILDENSVRPLVGVIPHNEDPATMILYDDSDFSVTLSSWIGKGWQIALHGFNHVCATDSGGMNPVHNRSEFAGLPLDEQRKKIAEGYNILCEWIKKSCGRGYEIKWFFAPSHTFDANTLAALRMETPIRCVSDGFAFMPFVSNGMKFVPCQMGVFRDMRLPGFFTFCYHPNMMGEDDFALFEKFIRANRGRFVGFDELCMENLHRKSLAGKLVSAAYLAMRKMKGN